MRLAAALTLSLLAAPAALPALTPAARAQTGVMQPLAQTNLPAPAPAPSAASPAAQQMPDEAARIAAIAAKLAAHRAVYKLTLDPGHTGDLVSAQGTMTYEVSDACDAWATQQRLQMTLTNRDGQDIEMVSDYATLESKDGRSIHFRMRQTTDTAVTEQVEGEAHLDRPGGTGEVHYTVPEDTTKTLPAGTLFPMTHTAAIIAGAEAGKKFLAIPLFDGTGPTGAQDSTVVIISWDKPAQNRFAALSELPSGRVRVAFYDREKQSQQSDYEVGMRYWENGIADDLSMDFGEFVMNGKLDQLKVAAPHC